MASATVLDAVVLAADARARAAPRASSIAPTRVAAASCRRGCRSSRRRPGRRRRRRRRRGPAAPRPAGPRRFAAASSTAACAGLRRRCLGGASAQRLARGVAARPPRRARVSQRASQRGQLVLEGLQPSFAASFDLRHVVRCGPSARSRCGARRARARAPAMRSLERRPARRAGRRCSIFTRAAAVSSRSTALSGSWRPEM